MNPQRLATLVSTCIFLQISSTAKRRGPARPAIVSPYYYSETSTSSGSSTASPSEISNKTAALRDTTTTTTLLCPNSNKDIDFRQLCDGVNDCDAHNNNNNNNNLTSSADEAHCKDGLYTGAFASSGGGGHQVSIVDPRLCMCFAREPRPLCDLLLTADVNSTCQVCENDQGRLAAGNCRAREGGRRWDDLRLGAGDVTFLQRLWKEGTWGHLEDPGK